MLYFKIYVFGWLYLRHSFKIASTNISSTRRIYFFFISSTCSFSSSALQPIYSTCSFSCFSLRPISSTYDLVQTNLCTKSMILIRSKKKFLDSESRSLKDGVADVTISADNFSPAQRRVIFLEFLYYVLKLYVLKYAYIAMNLFLCCLSKNIHFYCFLCILENFKIND